MPYWILAAVVLGLVVACGDSYSEAQAEADFYRDMVCQGYWPDYKQLSPDCTGFEHTAGPHKEVQ